MVSMNDLMMLVKLLRDLWCFHYNNFYCFLDKMLSPNVSGLTPNVSINSFQCFLGLSDDFLVKLMSDLWRFLCNNFLCFVFS